MIDFADARPAEDLVRRPGVRQVISIRQQLPVGTVQQSPSGINANVDIQPGRVTTPALPTARQYDLAVGAVQSAITVQKARVLQTSISMQNPALKASGSAALASGLAELRRLDVLLDQTIGARTQNGPIPMGALDLAIYQAAAQNSVALATRNYSLLARAAQDISGLIELQRGAPATPTVPVQPVVRPEVAISNPPAGGAVRNEVRNMIRGPASVDAAIAVPLPRMSTEPVKTSSGTVR